MQAEGSGEGQQVTAEGLHCTALDAQRSHSTLSLRPCKVLLQTTHLNGERTLTEDEDLEQAYKTFTKQ